MKMESLKELMINELQDLYSAEKQITKALPKMVNAAHSNQLRQGFQEHLAQTEEHVRRLEQIFDQLGESPKGKKCKGMEGVLEEGDEMIKQNADPEVKDAGLIAAAQHVEHYEIAGYGCVRTYANLLGMNQAVSLLEQTLNEEKQTDQKLSHLAQSINIEAKKAA